MDPHADDTWHRAGREGRGTNQVKGTGEDLGHVHEHLLVLRMGRGTIGHDFTTVSRVKGAKGCAGEWRPSSEGDDGGYAPAARAPAAGLVGE